LFIGAMLGGAVAGLASQVTPIDLGTYVLAGIGAVISPVIGAPITTILIVFEITDSYAVTSAVMTAVVVASVVSSQISGRSAFTQALEWRGHDLSKGRETRILESRTVADVMSERFLAVTPDTPLSACQAILSDAADRDLFVVDSAGRLLGRVTLFDALSAFVGHNRVEITAGEIARSSEAVFMLTARTNLIDALHQSRAHVGISIPVVDNMDSERLVGTIFESMLIRAYTEAVAQAQAEAQWRT
jgi:CIC family chloride channel protein